MADKKKMVKDGKSAVLAPDVLCEKKDEHVALVECSEATMSVAADAVDATTPGVVLEEPVDAGKSDGVVVVLGVVLDEAGVLSEPVETQKRSRRSNGSGSIWQAANGKYGICVQHGKTEDGKKLRHVTYFKTLPEAEAGLVECMADLNKLRASKLAKAPKK